MKKQLFAIFALLLLTLTTMAVPAKKGVHKTLMTTGGTLVTATLVGDEHGHFWRGSDGQAYHLQDDRFVPVDGTTIVRRAQMRRTRTNARRAQQLPSRRAIKYEGNKRCAIILVNFSDKTFTKSHDQAYFYRMANEKNFTQYPFKGSVSDYFSDQSRGQFNLEFDVLGPVTLSKKQSYYGGNDEEGYDKHPSEMVCEAVKPAISVAPDKKTKRYFTLDGRFVGTDYTALPRGLYLSDGKKIYHK